MYTRKTVLILESVTLYKFRYTFGSSYTKRDGRR